jgi:DNA-nicking Smr family endonuclease
LIVVKKNSKKTPNPKGFHAAPFGSLKGMVVPEVVPAQPAAPDAQKVVEPADGLDLFLLAVADVKPIHKQITKSARKESRNFSKKNAEAVKAVSQTEESASNLFLQEIIRLKLETKLADSAPDDGEIKTLSGNRLRQVKRGVVSVGYQLDLHGLRREEALTALPRFLRSALQREQKAVLVITGKGNHSAEEPVLQQAVASWLREAGRGMVLEFAPAPRELGGNGAFVVFLRVPSAKMV